MRLLRFAVCTHLKNYPFRSCIVNYYFFRFIENNMLVRANKSKVIRQMVSFTSKNRNLDKPTSSEVLTSYIKQCDEPPWTSYFVKYSSIRDDQWGKSHFNWKVGNSNYHILRTGCYPYIKYHCTKRKEQNLVVEDYFFRVIKVMNLGIPCLAYGIAAIFLIQHTEVVETPKGKVEIYFLYPEDKGSLY